MIKDQIEIIKNNHNGNQVWKYYGKIISQNSKGLIVEAFFNRPDLDFNGICLKQNDRFLELYLFEEWFNIYEIYDRDNGQLKAWYCNITRPVKVMDHRISYDDLALDLLVFPDSRQLALDEDEFIALELNADDTRRARQALEKLQLLFAGIDRMDVFALLNT